MTSAERVGAERCRPRPYQRKLGALVVVATLLTGCTLDRGGDDQIVTATRPEVPAHPLDQQMLADGEVTTVELNEAFRTYIGCMEDAGMVGRYAYDAERLGHNWTMEYNMPGDGPEGSLTDAIESRCYGRFVSPLEGHFDDPVSRSDRELQRRQSTIDCLVEVDPAFSTIPPDLPVEPGSDFQRQAFDIGNDAVTDCVDTAGVGWTEFGKAEQP